MDAEGVEVSGRRRLLLLRSSLPVICQGVLEDTCIGGCRINARLAFRPRELLRIWAKGGVEGPRRAPEWAVALSQELGTSYHSGLWGNWLATLSLEVFSWGCVHPGFQRALHAALAASINREASLFPLEA